MRSSCVMFVAAVCIVFLVKLDQYLTNQKYVPFYYQGPTDKEGRGTLATRMTSASHLGTVESCFVNL